jgi:hypothetical protein
MSVVRIEMPDQSGRARLTVPVDLRDPPAVVRLPDAARTAITLDWDRAIDDEGHLRHCPVCGCGGLYARKPVPQITVFVLLGLAGVAGAIAFGLNVWWPLGAVGLLLMVDVGIFLFTKRTLVCYRCGSVFVGMPIRRRHPGWDPALAEQHRGAG